MFKNIAMSIMLLLSPLTLKAVFLQECCLSEDNDPVRMYHNYLQFVDPYQNRKFLPESNGVSLKVNPNIEVDWAGFDLNRETDTPQMRAERHKILQEVGFLKQKEMEKVVCKMRNISPNYGFDIYHESAQEAIGYATVRVFSHSFYFEYLKIKPFYTGNKYGLDALKLREYLCKKNQAALPAKCDMIHFRTDTQNPMSHFASQLGYYQSTESGLPVKSPLAIGKGVPHKSLIWVKKFLKRL